MMPRSHHLNLASRELFLVRDPAFISTPVPPLIWVLTVKVAAPGWSPYRRTIQK
jgi:hypothetical protein